MPDDPFLPFLLLPFQYYRFPFPPDEKMNKAHRQHITPKQYGLKFPLRPSRFLKTLCTRSVPCRSYPSLNPNPASGKSYLNKRGLAIHIHNAP